MKLQKAGSRSKLQRFSGIKYIRGKRSFYVRQKMLRMFPTAQCVLFKCGPLKVEEDVCVAGISPLTE